MTHIILNGEAVQAENARVSVQDRGFRFGDGVFETIAVASGVPYRFDWHSGRLSAGLSAIRIAYPIGTLAGECKRLLHLNKINDGLLRIQVTRGSGGKGYLPADNAPTCVIEALPAQKLPKDPVSLYLSSYRKISPTALPVRYKIAQGLNSTLARMEARDHDCFDALLVNDKGEICETSSGNIFWLKDKTLFTPALDCGVLEGSIRSLLVELSPYPLHEIKADADALASAEAVLISNVAWKILPVNGLTPSGLRWESGKTAREIGALLDADIHNHCKRERHRWSAGNT